MFPSNPSTKASPDLLPLFRWRRPRRCAVAGAADSAAATGRGRGSGRHGARWRGTAPWMAWMAWMSWMVVVSSSTWPIKHPWSIVTSSTAQGGGGSFKNRKLIGEVGCCESRMAERSHWWTDRWLRSPLSLSFSLSLYLSIYLSVYLSVYLSISIYLSS